MSKFEELLKWVKRKQPKTLLFSEGAICVGSWRPKDGQHGRRGEISPRKLILQGKLSQRGRISVSIPISWDILLQIMVFSISSPLQWEIRLGFLCAVQFYSLRFGEYISQCTDCSMIYDKLEVKHLIFFIFYFFTMLLFYNNRKV